MSAPCQHGVNPGFVCNECSVAAHRTVTVPDDAGLWAGLAEAEASAPDELVDALAQAMHAESRWKIPWDRLATEWRSDYAGHARAVLAVPAIADALARNDVIRYRLRAEVRWLETQPASEWATTRQVAMLDVIRLLDGGPWVEREHVTDGPCWCDPEVIAVPAKKPATDPPDRPIQSCNCASYNMGPAPETALTPPPELGIETVCVDACIATVVQHLWSCGVVTLGSCCGHGRGRPGLVLGQHEDMAVARACISGVDDRAWDLSQWRLVENTDMNPANEKGNDQ